MKNRLKPNIANRFNLFSGICYISPINSYAKDIQEKIQELTDELIKGCKPDTVMCHCSALNTFAQDIIRQTESAGNDIPDRKGI